MTCSHTLHGWLPALLAQQVSLRSISAAQQLPFMWMHFFCAPCSCCAPMLLSTGLGQLGQSLCIPGCSRAVGMGQDVPSLCKAAVQEAPCSSACTYQGSAWSYPSPRAL